MQRRDGKVEVTLKGTILLLKEWFEKYYVFEERKPFDEMIDTFRNVRKLRMKPAHCLIDNEFD